MDVLQELSEDFLTCSICLNMYTEPKQLPCLHSFCRDCLSGHIKACDRGGIIAFPCPMCRKTVSPPTHDFSDPADDFPDNFYITSLVSSVARKGGESVPDRSELKDADKSSETAKDDNFCQNHPTITATEYCESQKVTVCSVCCQNHPECQDYHISFEVAKTKIVSKTSALKDLEKKSKTLLETLSEKPRNLRLRKEELEVEISEHFNKIRNKIAKHLLSSEREIMAKLQSMWREEETRTEESTTECKAICETCERKLEHLEKLSNRGIVGSLQYTDSFDPLLEKYQADTARIESGCDVNKIRYSRNTEVTDQLENMKLGYLVDDRTPVEDEGPEEPGEGDGESIEEQASGAVGQGLEEPVNYLSTTHITPSAPPPDDTVAAYRPSAPVRASVRISYQPYQNPSGPYGYQPTPSPPPSYRDVMHYGRTPFAQYQPAGQYQTAGQYGPYQPRGASASRSVVPADKKYASPSQNPDSFYLSRGRESDSGDNSDCVNLDKRKAFSLSFSTDTRPCKIVGISAVKDHMFVAVDRFNQNIKLMNLKGPEIITMQFKDKMEPWDLTRILSFERDDVAATFPNSKMIIILSCCKDLRGRHELKVVSEVPTRVGYASLGCINDKKLVCGVCRPFGPPQIHIISMNGNLLRAHTGIVTYPRSIDTSPGQVIAVSDWTAKEVVLMTEEGDVLKRYKGSSNGELKDPKGVTYYKEGTFLVMDRKTRRIHRINEDGFPEKVGRIFVDNASVLTCVPTGPNFSKDGLAIVVALDSGSVIFYDKC